MKATLMTLPMFPDDSSASVNSENIRRAWHNGEWYFSVIDIVAELLNFDYKRAQSYWSTLKERLLSDGRHDLLKSCHSLRLPAKDHKSRLTDIMPQSGLQVLYDEVLKHSRRRTTFRLEQERDEVAQFHPKVVDYLSKNGMGFEHHYALPSGRVVDFLAQKGGETWVIECKTRLLSRGECDLAVGQVLCYCTEFENPVRPCIAIPEHAISDYARKCCQKLGIVVITL